MASSPDPWLGRLFQRPVFKVEAEPDWKPTMPGFYFSKVPCHQTQLSEHLQSLGFRVVDTALTFRQAGRRSSGVEPQPARPDEAEALLALAESSFRYSRFHLDPRVSNHLADRIKREWVANYLTGVRGDALLVARRQGRPVGFLAALVLADQQRVIDLVAVAPEFQGQGIGAELLDQFCNWAGPHPRLVGTQAANLPSVKLYQRKGYELFQSQHVFHLHQEAPCAP